MPNCPVGDVIKRSDSADAWIVMKHVERDPAYAKVLQEWAEFVRALAGPKEARYLRSPEMLVFITSPGRMTPFHFDAEVNFLVQIAGSKDLWICDPFDRSITTENEIENFYAIAITAGNYKPVAEERPTHFRLAPGDAVHILTHSAHWVRNGSDVSISLNLNFEFPSWRQADIYCVNHYLRRAGLSPRGPGGSHWSDGTEATAGAASRAAARVKRLAAGVGTSWATA